MKSNLHTTENRLLGLLPEAEWVRLKAQPVSVEMAPGLVVVEPGDHVDHSRGLQHGRRRKLRTLLFLVLSCCLSTAAPAQKPASTDGTQASPKAAHHARLDRSGKTRKGKASYYGQKFYSKKMADGTRMNPQSNVAASKTLPLGTKARVTNLENGASEVVEIRDRGPYVKNRIVDVSPKTADKLGLKENGTAPVEVKPVEVPQPDGSVKPGAGAAQTGP
jgi:rare lipoprotein A